MDGYRCVEGETEIFLEVSESPDVQEASCEVILWSDEGKRHQLWHKADNPAKCRSHAERFKSVLENQRWQCQADTKTTAVAPMPKVSAGSAPGHTRQTKEGAIKRPSRPKPLPDLKKTTGYSCRRDAQKREIWQETAVSNGLLPCQILWTADSETKPVLLWIAKNEAGFCASKLAETLDQWARGGWTCRPEDEIAIPPMPERPQSPTAPIDTPAPDEIDLAKANPLPSRLGLLSESDQHAGPLGRIQNAARRLKPNRLDLVAMEHAAPNYLWIGDHEDLRERLIRDLDQLAEIYDSPFVVQDGMISDIYGEERTDAVVLVSYRDAKRALRFLLNVYRQTKGRHQLTGSLILDESWIAGSEGLSGYYLLSTNSGLN